ncbi:MAG: hypothetical protein OEY14_09525, partial [Myxococcales bacterium]|nr:hypothetical protein [Myxococcales bacterium]
MSIEPPPPSDFAPGIDSALEREDLEAGLEALAHGAELGPDAAPLEALHGDPRVQQAKALSIEIGLLFEQGGPSLDGLEAMVSAAIAQARPVPADVAPSRQALLWGSIVGFSLTASLLAISMGLIPAARTIPSLGAGLRALGNALVLHQALDRLVDALPGGWGLVSAAALLLLFLLLAPLRRLSDRRAPRSGRAPWRS